MAGPAPFLCMLLSQWCVQVYSVQFTNSFSRSCFRTKNQATNPRIFSIFPVHLAPLVPPSRLADGGLPVEGGSEPVVRAPTALVHAVVPPEADVPHRATRRVRERGDLPRLILPHRRNSVVSCSFSYHQNLSFSHNLLTHIPKPKHPNRVVEQQAATACRIFGISEIKNPGSLYLTGYKVSVGGFGDDKMDPQRWVFSLHTPYRFVVHSPGFL